MNRISMAGLAVSISIVTACSQNPAPAAPEPLPIPEVEPPVVLDSIGEAELRAFLLAEEEERILEIVADSVITPGDGDATNATIDQADFDLPITLNERVEFWLDYFQNRGRERFATYLHRMGRYEAMILDELRARGMPEELIYLALIESGFSPTARSTAAAVGVWQFIASTARMYDLEVSRYVDERRDPVKSTRAALDYLQALYDKFGSWYLAAAGYNSGENRIERLLRRYADGARGDDELFWKISPHLPSETRNYVPKLIAAAILGKYRDRYSFGDVQPEESITYDIVTVPDATELGVIARAAGVEQGLIEALNPHFPRGVTPPRRKVEVRVPSGHADQFRVAYAKIPPSERVTKIEHVVARGETLSGIAKRYRTTVAAIQETNEIKNPHSIRAGRRLVIDYRAARAAGEAAPTTDRPAAVKGDSQMAVGSSTKASQTIYRVRPGDSLWSIARRHGVSVRDLRIWNDLENDKIFPGQRLRIGGAQVIVYRIQPGDTIWDIALRHGVSPDRLMQWNRIDAGATIRPGDELEVPVTP